MPGKYEHITPNLPKFIEPEKHREKVEEKKTELLNGRVGVPARELATLFVGLRTKKDETEAQLKQDNLMLEAARDLLCEAMDDDNTTSLGLTGIGTIRVQREPYAEVKDKAQFRKWCVRNGLEESLMLPWQSTNSITKERLLAGKPEPDGVEAFQKDKVVLTRTR